MSYTFNKLKVGQRLTFYGYDEAGDEAAYDAIVESINREEDTLVIVIDDPDAKSHWKPGDFCLMFRRDEVDNTDDPLFGKPRRSNKLTLEPSYTYSLVFTHEGKELGRVEAKDPEFILGLIGKAPNRLPDAVQTRKWRQRAGTSTRLEGWE